MAAERLTDKDVLNAVPDANDVFHVVDKSDISSNPAGTSKQVAYENLVTNNPDVAANTSARHDPVTLNADDPTQQTLNLVGQELQVNQATPSSDGAMSSEDKSKTDLITATIPANLDQIQADLTTLETGYSRRRACIALADATSAPPTEVSGDRYVLIGSPVDSDWDGAAENDIVQFNGTTWDAQTPEIGWVTFITGQGQDALFSDDGGPQWELRPIVVTSHLDLMDIGTNTHAQIDDHINSTANPHQVTVSQALTADPATDATAAELEQLTDGSNSDSLHQHTFITDGVNNSAAILAGAFIATLGGIARWTVSAVGNLVASAYPQSRNDGTVADQRTWYTDAGGNVLQGKVLPYLATLTDTAGGINQNTTPTTYITLNFTITEDGTYPIDYSYVWSYNSGTQDFIGEVVLDTVPPSAADTLVTHQQEPKDTGGTGVNLPDLNGGAPINSGTNQRYVLMGFTTRPLTAGDYSLRIQIYATSANNEAAVYQGNLRVGHRTNV